MLDPTPAPARAVFRSVAGPGVFASSPELDVGPSATARASTPSQLQASLRGSRISRARAALVMQRTAGNARLSRMSASAGPRLGSVQPKLEVSRPGDVYEREADEMAQLVARRATPASSAAGAVQRKVAARRSDASIQRRCPACDEQIRRMPSTDEAGSAAEEVEPQLQAMLQGGEPMPSHVQRHFEPHFGTSFDHVRLHRDERADVLAQSLGAEAFTLGSHVAFRKGRYEPESSAGQKLLAHELTHVVQQTGERTGAGAPAEDSAAADVQRSVAPRVQRTLTVDPDDVIPLPPGVLGPPKPLTVAVQQLLEDTCPEGDFQVNLGTGAVTPGDPSFCGPAGVPYRADVRRADISSTPVGCGCICDVVSHARTTTVEFQPGGPGTAPGSVQGAGAGQGGVQTNATVYIDPRFQGQYRINGHWVNVPFHLLFSHELCGHALPKMRGTHAQRGATPPGGTPSHERHAVDVERAIAAEGGHPRRPEDYSGAARERP